MWKLYQITLIIVGGLIVCSILTGCNKPAEQIHDDGFKECILYKGMIEGYWVIASPNCHIAK